MKRITLIICSILTAGTLAAQVKVTATQTAEGYALDVRKGGPGVYSVLVRMKEDGKLLRDTVSVSRRFHLFPPEQGAPRYDVQTALGNAWGEVDGSVMYRLPYSTHKKDAVYSMAIDDGPVHAFTLSPGDTVYAARRGTVVGVGRTDDKRGEILIQHLDGSWARYRGVAATVAPGDRVWADTPIGLAGKSRKGYVVTLAVKYPTAVVDRRGRSRMMLADMSPSFAVASSTPVPGRANTYIWVARLGYDMLTQEMTPEDMELMRRAAGGE